MGLVRGRNQHVSTGEILRGLVPGGGLQDIAKLPVAVGLDADEAVRATRTPRARNNLEELPTLDEFDSELRSFHLFLGRDVIVAPAHIVGDQVVRILLDGDIEIVLGQDVLTGENRLQLRLESRDLGPNLFNSIRIHKYIMPESKRKAIVKT